MLDYVNLDLIMKNDWQDLNKDVENQKVNKVYFGYTKR